MRAKEAAILLGVHVTTVRKYWRELGGKKLGRIYVFDKLALFRNWDDVRPVSWEWKQAHIQEEQQRRQFADPHGLLD